MIRLGAVNIKATLWDGSKQLNGEIQFSPNHLSLTMTDFSRSELNLKIKYEDVASVRLYRVYKIALEGVEVTTKEGGQNIFISKNASLIKKQIEEGMNSK